MDKVLTILAATLIAGSAAAEPPRTSAAKSGEAKPRPAEVVFAATDTQHAPAPDTQPNAAPAKRRVARITTCRCGDPQVDTGSQEQ